MEGYLVRFSTGLAIALFLKVVHSIASSARLRRRMPPGPQGLPLLGHAHKLGSFQWLQFAEWQAAYGPIFSLNLAGQPAVVIGDLEIVHDLLDDRSTVYSDRPRWIMGSEILTGGMFLPLMSYNDTWRRMRRLVHDKLQIRACTDFCGLQERGAASLVVSLVQDPLHYSDHLGRCTADVLLQAVYGGDANSTDGQDISRAIREFIHRVGSAILPGSYLVDMFPWMLHIPAVLSRWKQDGRNWFTRESHIFGSMLTEVQNRMDAGHAESCIAEKLIQEREKYDLNMEESSWLAGTVLLRQPKERERLSSLSVYSQQRRLSATMMVFILAMVLYPDVMLRAQKQIDTVVDRDRLPSFKDRAKLPFIEAVVKEVLRWRPITPLGGPRRTTQDDQYRGYLIPKGTLVLYNTWSIHRDPKYYPDYDEFRPERYLDTAGQITDCIPNTHGYGHLTYGTGRRICPGKDFANQALFIDIATMLWAFDFGKATDADGRPITPSRTDCVDDGLTMYETYHPAPLGSDVLFPLVILDISSVLSRRVSPKSIPSPLLQLAMTMAKSSVNIFAPQILT